jgi:hypothetical protein
MDVPRIRLIASASSQLIPWEERIKTVPELRHIRILDPPVTEPILLSFLWMKDMTLTEWIRKTESASVSGSTNNPLCPSDYQDRIKTIFAANQRQRWLARIVLHRWTQRIWRKRTQCNVDMIDMQAIPDADAIFLTDTKHRTIFRFHSRDVFKNLITNICMSDEMLPTPRYPTNPWTNSKLTMAQTMGLCQQLAAAYGAKGRCPPILFAAFWAARFSLRRFQEENSGLLAQHAVTSYFKDLHDYNHIVVLDTITNLLTDAGLNYSPLAIKRWLRETPQTPLHREWLNMARDYTLYINLHVQVRPSWIAETRIYSDVRDLYSRTVLPDTTSQRLQIIRSNSLMDLIPSPPLMYGLLGLPMLLQPPLEGLTLSEELALQLIQQSINAAPNTDNESQ